jgi:PAS domain S-box-containing protein
MGDDWSSIDAGADRPASLRRMVADLVLEKAAEGIWLIDAEARTTFVNRRVADLLGYTEEEMLGKHVFAFIDRGRWPVADRNLKHRALGIEERLEVEMLRKDGTRIWVLGSASPVFDRDGAYAGSLALLGDLTAQKRTEQRLRAEVEELRARLASASRPRDDGGATPPLREPFRSAIVLATSCTFVATVALLTAGAVASSLFGAPSPAGTLDV